MLAALCRIEATFSKSFFIVTLDIIHGNIFDFFKPFYSDIGVHFISFISHYLVGLNLTGKKFFDVML